MIVPNAPVCRFGGRTGPCLAIVLVEVPFPFDWSFVVEHQNLMLRAHLPIKTLHEPSFLPGKQSCYLGARRIKMLTGDHRADDRVCLNVLLKLLVKAPLIGLLIFKVGAALLGQQGIKVSGQALLIAWIGERNVVHTMPTRLQPTR